MTRGLTTSLRAEMMNEIKPIDGMTSCFYKFADNEIWVIASNDLMENDEYMYYLSNYFHDKMRELTVRRYGK